VLPVTRRSGPTLRAVGLGGLVAGVTLFEDRDILPAMALARGDGLQGTVAVNLVVPVLEPGNPLTGLLEGLEGFIGKARGVLQGLEQGLGIGVVVADRGPAERS